MDDPRLSRMYLALVTRRIAALWRGFWIWCTLHFGSVVLGLILALCAVLVVGWRAHERGRFARLKVQLKESQTFQEPKSPQPGGQDALLLQRTQISGGTMPEFLSATLLPGRGMDLLQITAYLPDKGEVPLLEAPSLEEATKTMTGQGADAHGALDLTAGGPLELPWAGGIYGDGDGADGGNVAAMWRGRTLLLPSMGRNGRPGVVEGGLLLNRASSAVSSNVMPDGGATQVRFAPGNFGRLWPSATEVTATVLLSRNVMEMKVLARNTGTEEEPMGIGWAPRFRMQSGTTSEALLKLPSTTRLERRADGQPTGRMLPVEGTGMDFSSRGGARIGAQGLDETFVDLHSALFDLGPVVELRDPRSNYGLRLTAMTPMIKAIHVRSAANGRYVSISDQTNLDDPFGREWRPETESGMITLRPGESLQWTVRLEIFPLSS